jgi:flagellar protein FliL
MVANRTEQPATPEDGAAAAPAAETAPAAPGGFKAWLPLVIVVVAMPALAFGMTQFVLLPKLQKGLGMSAPAKTETVKTDGKTDAKAEPENTESYTMNKLLVNVAGTMGQRYLLVSLSVVGSDTDFKGKMQTHDPQLRDMAQGALCTKTLADLEKPGSRNLIRTELISGFNNILGGAMVHEIYLTEFAIQ